MKRHDLKELHYITPIDNVPSILSDGILSHTKAEKVPHASVAMPEIQRRRSPVAVPGGGKLHDYANLYICARNPMLYKRLLEGHQLCVIIVSTDVLDLKGVVISDSNASGNYVRFAPSPDGLSIVDAELTFADDWRDKISAEFYRKRSAKCAEVLVHDRIDPKFITGVYVANEGTKKLFDGLKTGLECKINEHLFFKDEVPL